MLKPPVSSWPLTTSQAREFWIASRDVYVGAYPSRRLALSMLIEGLCAMWSQVTWAVASVTVSRQTSQLRKERRLGWPKSSAIASA